MVRNNQIRRRTKRRIIYIRIGKSKKEDEYKKLKKQVDALK
jgi:hypothetical protein